MSYLFHPITIEAIRTCISSNDRGEIFRQFEKNGFTEPCYGKSESSDYAAFYLDLIDWGSAEQSRRAIQAIQALLYYVSPEKNNGQISDAWIKLAEKFKRDGWTLYDDGMLEEDFLDLDAIIDYLDGISDVMAIRLAVGRIKRMSGEPYLQIGAARELVEMTSKIILKEIINGRYVSDLEEKFPKAFGKQPGFEDLIKAVHYSLGLGQKKLIVGATCDEELDRQKKFNQIHDCLCKIAVGLNWMRNKGCGSGHGHVNVAKGVYERHGRLAVNAATVWCLFIADTFIDFTIMVGAKP